MERGGGRALAGVGWAGTYMTGLKLLADRVEPALMSRAVAGHAASIGIAGAFSFVFAGRSEGGPVGAAPSSPPRSPRPRLADRGRLRAARDAPPRDRAAGGLFDFRPVLRNRSAMAYAVAYCAHTWEMNALRGWAVAFLAYVAATTGGPGTGSRPPWSRPPWGWSAPGRAWPATSCRSASADSGWSASP